MLVSWTFHKLAPILFYLTIYKVPQYEGLHMESGSERREKGQNT